MPGRWTSSKSPDRRSGFDDLYPATLATPEPREVLLWGVLQLKGAHFLLVAAAHAAGNRKPRSHIPATNGFDYPSHLLCEVKASFHFDLVHVGSCLEGEINLINPFPC